MSLAYDEAGKNNTLPLIFLHAFPIDRKMWRHQVDSLSDIAHVIAPDIPGFGESSALKHERPSIEHYAQSIHDFMLQKNLKKAVLAGSSMGGYILFELWRMNPNLFSGMILIDTRSEEDDEDARNARLQSISFIERQGSSALSSVMPKKALGETTQQNNKQLFEEMKQTIEAAPPEGIIFAQRAMANRNNSRETLSTINVPTLIIVGEEDSITPPEVAETMKNAILDSKMIIIPKAGHLSPIEQPEAVNKAIKDFLKEII